VVAAGRGPTRRSSLSASGDKTFLTTGETDSHTPQTQLVGRSARAGFLMEQVPRLKIKIVYKYEEEA